MSYTQKAIMKKKDYGTLLKNAPDHLSPAFLDYLRENNEVVEENDYWLIIKNFKYDWLTAFSKNLPPAIHKLPSKYQDWEWKKKPANKQTVKRFHLHLIPNRELL